MSIVCAMPCRGYRREEKCSQQFNSMFDYIPSHVDPEAVTKAAMWNIAVRASGSITWSQMDCLACSTMQGVSQVSIIAAGIRL